MADQLRETAKLLFAADAILAEDAKLADDALAYAERVSWSVDNEAMWANGRHEGDCTNQPHSCLRCTMENYEDAARKVLASDIDIPELIPA